MIKEGKFGVHEAVCLVTITIGSKIFFTSPGYVTRSVGTAGWYMTLISCAAAGVLFSLVYLLLKRFPGKNIVEIFDASLGRVIGFIFSFSLMVTFLASSGIFLREFVDVMKVYVFPLSPPSFLTGVFIIVVSIAAFLGLETIARVAKLTAYFGLFGYFLLFLLASQYYKVAHLFPLLGYGLGKTVVYGLIRSSGYGEVVVLAVFAGSLQGIGHIKKAGYIALFLSGFLVASGSLCYSLIFEYTSTQELTAPIYVVARLIQYGIFFQRLDPFFLFIWIIITVISVSSLFYTAVSIYCKMFRLQDTRPVILPMTILAFTIASFPRDFTGVIAKYVQGLRTYGNITFFILPAIALAVALMRKKKGEDRQIEN